MSTKSFASKNLFLVRIFNYTNNTPNIFNIIENYKTVELNTDSLIIIILQLQEL